MRLVKNKNKPEENIKLQRAKKQTLVTLKQMSLLKRQRSAYGGELLKTRKGRSGPRTLDTRNSMHLVLRSTKAKGEWSFKTSINENKIRKIIHKFANKYGVKILSLANVGNHLHFHIKLGNRYSYKPFIRAITASIAMVVTGVSRWNKLKYKPGDRFWDHRPFTRVIESFRELLNLKHYIQINRLEGCGYNRLQAKLILKGFKYSALNISIRSGTG